MKNYNPKIKSSYIMYFDANNLYGGAMCKKQPIGGFKWINPKDFDINLIKNYKNDDVIGYYIMCDLKYPKSLHKLHNDYPLLPENINPDE